MSVVCVLFSSSTVWSFYFWGFFWWIDFLPELLPYPSIHRFFFLIEKHLSIMRFDVSRRVWFRWKWSPPPRPHKIMHNLFLFVSFSSSKNLPGACSTFPAFSHFCWRKKKNEGRKEEATLDRMSFVMCFDCLTFVSFHVVVFARQSETFALTQPSTFLNLFLCSFFIYYYDFLELEKKGGEDKHTPRTWPELEGGRADR